MTDEPMFKGSSSRPVSWPMRRWGAKVINPTMPDLWNLADNRRAKDEGWCIYKHEGAWTIGTLTTAMPTDEDAHRWVGMKADRGSDLHIRALAAVAALAIREG